jgi:hypothetical protein
MSARVPPFIVAVTVAGAVLVAGCGSSGSSSSSTTAALTKEQWIAQADAICKQDNKNINSAARKTFGNQKPSQQQLTQFVNETLIPSLETELSDIRALTPPAGDEDTVNNLLADVDTAIQQTKQDPTSAVSNGSNSPFAKPDQEAKAYGLKVCGQS